MMPGQWRKEPGRVEQWRWAHNPEVAGSCKELRCLISSGFQGCMSIPGWSGRWRRLGSEAGVMPGLADLIATAGLATDDPHEGSGPARLVLGLVRLQHMSGSRCRA